MADTRIRVTPATDVLREDHKTVKKLFKDYQALEEGSDDEKLQIFRQIQNAITIHATVEEEIFYPAVEGIGEEIVAEAREEHKVVTTLLEELSGLEPSVEEFDAKMKVLQENVEHHVEEEEDQMFPLFGELDKDDQEIVSENLSARKSELSREIPESPDE